MAKKQYSFSEIEVDKNFPSRISTHVDWKPQTNIIESGPMLSIEVELPGVKKEDVSILLHEDGELVIKGVKHQPRIDNPKDTATYHLFEREFGSFYKKVDVPFPLDESRISSTMENGVLVISIPRKKAQKIPVDIQ